MEQKKSSLGDRIKEFFFPKKKKVNNEEEAEDFEAIPMTVSPMKAYLADEPEELAGFVQSFQPQNEHETAIFNYIVDMGLNKGVKLHDLSFELAQIGNANVLRFLFENYTNNRDYEIRKAIMENLKCPEDLLVLGASDPDWEVRKAALTNPSMSQSHVRDRYYCEMNPTVLTAIKERLGEEYLQNTVPMWRPLAGRSSERRLEEPNKSFYEQLKKQQGQNRRLSFDDLFSDAQIQRQNTQNKRRDIDREIDFDL